MKEIDKKHWEKLALRERERERREGLGEVSLERNRQEALEKVSFLIPIDWNGCTN